MNGTKPTTDNLHIIVRDFRGTQLVLVSYDGQTGFHWTNAIHGKDKAAKFPQAVALKIADKASREYGAKCATMDATGTLIQPASAVPKEPQEPEILPNGHIRFAPLGSYSAVDSLNARLDRDLGAAPAGDPTT